MKTKITILITTLLILIPIFSSPVSVQSSQKYTTKCSSKGSCICVTAKTKYASPSFPSLEACKKALGSALNEELTDKINQSNDLHCITSTGKSGINTALGCLPTTLSGDGFIKSILQLGIGIGGAIALILIVYGLFLITTSGGIPDKVNAGKEIITSAIAGLIFIIFSTILMNIIGINILGLPGLQ